MSKAKLNTSKHETSAIMPRKDCEKLGAECAAFDKGLMEKRATFYRRIAKALTALLAGDDVKEYDGRMTAFAKGALGADYSPVAWSKSGVYRGILRAFKDIGFTSPKARTKASNSAKATAERNEKLKAKITKEVRQRMPKAKGASLEAAVAAAFDTAKEEARESRKERTALMAWCGALAKLNAKLPELATADVREIQLRLAAVIASVNEITPSAEE